MCAFALSTMISAMNLGVSSSARRPDGERAGWRALAAGRREIALCALECCELRLPNLTSELGIFLASLALDDQQLAFKWTSGPAVADVSPDQNL